MDLRIRNGTLLDQKTKQKKISFLSFIVKIFLFFGKSRLVKSLNSSCWKCRSQFKQFFIKRWIKWKCLEESPASFLRKDCSHSYLECKGGSKGRETDETCTVPVVPVRDELGRPSDLRLSQHLGSRRPGPWTNVKRRYRLDNRGLNTS